VASRLPVYEEVLGDGDRGFIFEPGEVQTLAAHLLRLISEPQLRGSGIPGVPGAARGLGWAAGGREFEQVYEELTASRHVDPGLTSVRDRLRSRP